MVNMIGFHHRDPEYNTAGYGDPGHYFHVRETPTIPNPQRAVVRFPCGRAMFESAVHATEYLNHPGDIGHAARFYIEFLNGGPRRAALELANGEPQ